jgi:hypothetical protein
MKDIILDLDAAVDGLTAQFPCFTPKFSQRDQPIFEEKTARLSFVPLTLEVLRDAKEEKQQDADCAGPERGPAQMAVASPRANRLVRKARGGRIRCGLIPFDLSFRRQLARPLRRLSFCRQSMTCVLSLFRRQQQSETLFWKLRKLTRASTGVHTL